MHSFHKVMNWHVSSSFTCPPPPQYYLSLNMHFILHFSFFVISYFVRDKSQKVKKRHQDLPLRVSQDIIGKTE